MKRKKESNEKKERKKEGKLNKWVWKTSNTELQNIEGIEKRKEKKNY